MNKNLASSAINLTDVTIMPIGHNKELVIASDNSGAIGSKQHDEVQVTDEVVSYFACRVAYMDLLRIGGNLLTIVMHNFTGDDAWQQYEKGVHQFLKESKEKNITITGSTESNFPTLQSGLGVTMVGIRKKQKPKKQLEINTSYAVVGKPLVGEQVYTYPDDIAPLSLYKQLATLKEVIDVVPVGSKGIQTEWEQLTGKKKTLVSPLNITQSGGPATCFIIAFNEQDRATIKKVAANYFYPLDPSK